MRKTLAGITVGGMAFGTIWMGVAAPHDFNGGGDCDSYTIVLDGTYEAHTILIDGVAQAEVKLTYDIPDTSDNEERSFTVKWDKTSNDIIKTHTLERDTSDCVSKKVTICHATNSNTNPYTHPTVDADAVDGDTGNDNGNGDHQTHTGPVWNPLLKDQQISWGDIIPPFYEDGSPGYWPSKNWDTAGQALYRAGCQIPKPDDLVEYTEWEDGDYECPDTTVEQTRSKTTTTYKLVQGEWVVDTVTTVEETRTRDLTLEEQQSVCEEPESKVEYTEWVDGDYECGDTTVVQTRTKTVTNYTFVSGEGWVADEPIVTEETQTRDLTAEEQEEACPVITPFAFGAALTECQSGVPYIVITFQNTYPQLAGLTGTLFIDTLAEEPVSNQPLVYQPGTTVQVLYPGATVDENGEVTDLPGWNLNDDGFWVRDPSDEFLRDGLLLRYELNPTATAEVTYPPESSLCSSPENPPVDPPVDPPVTPPTSPPVTKTSLPVTGSETGMLVSLGGLLLAAGAVTLFVKKRLI